MSQFQARLKELKEASGKTQARIAEDLGITPQAFSYYMNGREPDYDILVKIAQYFNVSVDYLVGTVDVKRSENAGIYERLGLLDQTIDFFVHLKKDEEMLSLILNLLLTNPKTEEILRNISLYIRPDSYIEKIASAMNSQKEEYKLSLNEITSDLLLSAIKLRAESLFGSIIDELKGEIQSYKTNHNPQTETSES